MVVALCAHLNNSENEQHEEISLIDNSLQGVFGMYCAFVHAFTSRDVKRHRPGLWP
jgi:hypothetical protein